MKIFDRIWSAVSRRPRADSHKSGVDPPAPTARLPILVVVEGTNDIEFLRRISIELHKDDPSIPELSILESRGEIVFLPIGGGDLRSWAIRLAGLGRLEFHLYDREILPETASRRLAVEIVNQRAGCRAVLTSKRSLENYLHPAAIRECFGIDVSYSDDEPVADVVAARLFALEEGSIGWLELPPRSRRHRRERAKRRLNREVVSRMTLKRLSERDPTNEVRSWLAEIESLVLGAR